MILNKKTQKNLVLLSILSAGLLFSEQAQSQRGYTNQNPDSPWDTPSSGFSGMFDTFLVKENSVTFDIFSLSIDYGFSKSLTAGVNLLPMILLPQGSSGAIFKAKYRNVSTKLFTVTTSPYLGILMKSKKSSNFLYAFVLNAQYFFSSHDWISASFPNALLYSSNSDSFGKIISKTFLTGLGLGYENFKLINSNLGLTLNTVFPTYLWEQTDKNSERLQEEQLCAQSPGIPMLRFGLKWRATEAWLLSTEFWHLPQIQSKDSFNLYPTFSASRSW